MTLNLTKPQKLMKRGLLDEAELALPAPGKHRDPRSEIIRSRLEDMRGNLPGAISVLADAIEQFPDHAPFYLFKGIYQWDLGNTDEALSSFDEVLRHQIKNDLASSYKALCLLALGNPTDAAVHWKKYGFSDNTMFRVRVIEFVESAWLRDRVYLDQQLPGKITYGKKFSQRKALSFFYRRNFPQMLKYVTPAPTKNDLEAFLAGTAHEMLRHYDTAKSYVDAFLPQRDEWPEPFIALNARLLVREGNIAEAATQFEQIVVMGPEDFGLNYYMGIICLSYEMRSEARHYFFKALTDYMVDTIEFQWWQIEQVLLNPATAVNTSEKASPL